MCKPDDDDDDDNRPLVKDLLEQHASAIESVRQIIRSDETIGKTLWDPERYDDIWILRFVLSHKGNTKHASRAALKTMKYRDEWKLNEKTDYKYRIKNCGFEDNSKNESLPVFDKFNTYCSENAMVFSHPDPDRGILVYCDIAAFDHDGMMNLSDRENMEGRFCFTEAQYQILDEVTRRTGKLTKLVRFLNLENYSFLKFNRKYMKRDAAVQKELEDYYPQLVEKSYIFNMPSWLTAVWKVIVALFPKRAVEKLEVCPSDACQKFYEPIRKYVTEENQPARFGGKSTNWPPPSIADLQSHEISSDE